MATMKLISVNEKLPDDNQYVLAHLVIDNWHDDDGDPNGNRYWQVLKFVRGSHEDEDDTDSYYWEEFGPDEFEADEVDFWCELPNLADQPRANYKTGININAY